MSDNEKRSVRDLLSDAPQAQLYVWQGSTYAGNGKYEDAPPPVGGDTASQGAIDMCPIDREGDYREGARYVEIPATSWGDYCGSTYTRSNARSLVRDFPDELVTLLSGYGGECLILPLDGEISEALYDAIVGLGDYPVYDESDMSELESELEQEDWESWGRDDMAREVRKLAVAINPDDDVTELDDNEALDAMVWDLTKDDGFMYWQAETAVSGYFTDFDTAAGMVWAEIQAGRERDLDARGRELSAPIPGQITLI